MNFEQRKAEAQVLVCYFLEGFSIPRGLDGSGQAARIAAIADAFARRMPTTGNFHEACEAVFAKVRDTHLSNSWPSQAVFVMAMPQSEKLGPKAAETFAPRETEWAAKRMRQGEAVPERYVWGEASARLIRDNDIGRDVMDRYRESSVKAHKSVYGPDAHKILERSYGAVVGPYFAAGAA